MSVKFKMLNNTKQYEIHMAEVKGLLASYLLKKSSYRPYKSRK